MSLFKPRVSFLQILHHLSVSWHKIPLKFSSWIILLWTKRAHQSTNFATFVCFNENSTNSSCQFWNHKVKVYSNFASLFSVMKYNSSVFFLSQTFILWTKRARRSEIFRLLSGWVKIQQILYAMFETTWEITLLYFLTETVYDLDQRSP